MRIWVRKSIRNKALLIFVLFSILPLLTLGIITNARASKILENKLNHLATRTIESLAVSISKDFQSLADIVNNFSENEDLHSLLGSVSGPEDRVRVFYGIKAKVENNQMVKYLNYPYHYIVIIGDDNVFTNFTHSAGGTYKKLEEQINREKWYQDLKRSHYRQMVIFSHSNYLMDNSQEQIYIAGNLLRDQDNVGVFLLGVDEYHFSKLLRNVRASERSSLYLVDRLGNCLVEGKGNYYKAKGLPADFMQDIAAQGDQTGFLDISEKKHMVISKGFSLRGMEEGWHLVMATPVEDIHREINEINYITILLLAFCLAALGLLLLIINREMINPIIQLNAKMKEVQHGNLNVEAWEKRREDRVQDEIGQLGSGFNRMVSNLRQYIGEIRQSEELKRKLEFRFLQAQINPHFAVNTLNTIRMMADMKKATGISKSIQAFMNLLSYNFREADVLVPVRSELENLREYFYIQNLRYQNKFNITMEVEDEILDCRILKLLFQPIAENSILHGLENRKGQGNITILGCKREDGLVFSILDDGVGMDGEKLAQILQGEESPTEGRKKKFGSIGIVNIQQRIKIHFGEKYGLTMTSTPGKGTETTLLLPLIKESDDKGCSKRESIDCR